MKSVVSYLLLFSAVVLSNCGNDAAIAIKPSHLIVETTIRTDGSGLVQAIATANDAEQYVFTFGEDFTATPIVSTDGKAEYTYLNSGTYNVKVVAYSADALTVEKIVSVSIQVAEPAVADEGYRTPESYMGKTLVWQDEFRGNQLNTSFWTHETGNNNGWGNNELQHYQSNNTIVQDGFLIIKAMKEGSGYTSSRIVTKEKKEFKYGRIDIRAKLPKGQGIWPALWMLGSNISMVSWPKCGEIDIMEMIGGGAGRDNKLYGTVHWDNAGTYASYGGNTTLTGTSIFADEFHVFSIAWDETRIVWYLDDIQYHSIDITPAELSEFRNNYFFIFNVAVGGNWPGSPNGSTVFPQRMIVDYIRVFQ